MNFRNLLLYCLIILTLRTIPDKSSEDFSEPPNLFPYVESKVLEKEQEIEHVGAAEPFGPVPFKLVNKPVYRLLPTIYNINWGGYIDLETYRNDGCFCPMCVGIRQLQKDGRDNLNKEYNEQLALYNEQQVMLADLIGQDSKMDLAAQQGTPIKVVRDTLSLMGLNKDDVLVDYGCGDGRVLIEAYKMYGIKSIGIEINPQVALSALDNIQRAGLSDYISIYVGDVRQFDLENSGATALYCYLYEELLGQLSDHFNKVRVVGSPYHEITGSSLFRADSINIWIKK